jgi:UV DNA damage endonuclease
MIGYCCISLSPNIGKSKKDQLLVNRGMIKKTFETKGLSYVSELALLNLKDCKKILEWNVKNDILVYRLSSDMFPCLGFYRLEDLPKFDLIKRTLEDIGKYVIENGIRVTFHPSHFCVLASDKPLVVSNAVDELNKHAQIFDLMGLPMTPYHAINIHIGTTKPTLSDAANRFVDNFNLLSDSCKRRLTIENDDSPNQYSVLKLYKMVYEKIFIPIVFDQHHFNYGPQDQTMEEALKLSFSTWGGIKPLTHMSSSRKLEDKKAVSTAHADYIYEKIQTFGLDFDTEIEAKAKDLAVIKYRKDFL